MVGDFRRGPARGPLKDSNRFIQIECRLNAELLLSQDLRRGPAQGPLKNSNRSIQIVCRISVEF